MKPFSKRQSKPLKGARFVANKSIKDTQAKDNSQHSDGVIMVDTIRVRYNIKLDSTLFRKSDWRKATKEECAKEQVFAMYYKNHITSNDNMIKIIYMPYDFTKKPNLAFEFSVAKVMWGNNYQIWPGEVMISIINAELKKIADELGIAPLDIMAGEITRMDIGKNWKVDERIKDYIRFLSKINYSPRTRKIYQNNSNKAKKTGEDNGVSYSTDHKVTKVYEKFNEANAPESKGILRVELSTVGSKNIDKLFGMKRAKFSDITKSICRAALQKELETLGLDKPITSTVDVIERLTGKVKPAMFQKLMRYITAKQKYPNMNNKAIAEYLGCTTQSVNAYIRKLDKMGICVLEDLTETLPALSLDDPETYRFFSKVLSNTTAEGDQSYDDKLLDSNSKTADKKDTDRISSLLMENSMEVKRKTKRHLLLCRTSTKVGKLQWPPSSGYRASGKDNETHHSGL